MIYVPEQKNTILIPSGTIETPDKKHLFIIMTKVCQEGHHLVVSVSSVKDGLRHDSTCELGIGSHPFITKPSFILYARAERLRSNLLAKCVEGWVYTPRERLDDAVFERVCDGVEISPYTPRWVKRYFATNR